MKKFNVLLAPTTGLAVLSSLYLGGCAVPATQVAVDTLSMNDALQRNARPMAHDIAPDLSRPGVLATPDTHPVATMTPPTAPYQLPSVRMVYVFDWVDELGFRHYGHWVAMPVGRFHWVTQP